MSSRRKRTRNPGPRSLASYSFFIRPDPGKVKGKFHKLPPPDKERGRAGQCARSALEGRAVSYWDPRKQLHPAVIGCSPEGKDVRQLLRSRQVCAKLWKIIHAPCKLPYDMFSCGTMSLYLLRCMMSSEFFIFRRKTGRSHAYGKGQAGEAVGADGGPTL